MKEELVSLSDWRWANREPNNLVGFAIRGPPFIEIVKMLLCPAHQPQEPKFIQDLTLLDWVETYIPWP